MHASIVCALLAAWMANCAARTQRAANLSRLKFVFELCALTNISREGASDVCFCDTKLVYRTKLDLNISWARYLDGLTYPPCRRPHDMCICTCSQRDGLCCELPASARVASRASHRECERPVAHILMLCKRHEHSAARSLPAQSAQSTYP